MLIGAHVSPAGGPAKAVERGVERGARSIQIFNQNPRAWKPREYSDEEVADFRAAMADSDVDALLIHAVYLLNCASEDDEIREKSLASLTHSLRAGAALGARRRRAAPGLGAQGRRRRRRSSAPATVIAEALAESERCPLHLEDTAGAGGTLGRSFEELARLIELAGGDERLGVCLDSCHLLASGYDIRTRRGARPRCSTTSTASSASTGSARCTSTTPQTPLGSNRDRHANLGDGEIGARGLRRVPVRAALRGAAVRARGPGREGQGRRRGDLAAAFEAARGGPGGARRAARRER